MERERIKRFYCVMELSEYLGVKEPTLRDWIRFKKIPYLKLSKCIRFDIGEINQWLEVKRVAML